MTDLDNASAEIIEMRAISDLMARSGRPLPETIMPSERMLGGTDENASLVVHINSINKSTGGGVDASSNSSGGGGEKKSEVLQVCCVGWLEGYDGMIGRKQDHICLYYGDPSQQEL